MGHRELDQLRGLLGESVRVEIEDGRRFSGVFVCVDEAANVVLDEAIESMPAHHHHHHHHHHHPTSPSPPSRQLGLIQVPLRHIVRMLAPVRLIPTQPSIPPDLLSAP
ncbi:hypothetical protein PCANC_27230 [Puccinia coronata f. sp. avenae]|uniref:Sm domain-containing protein n=1 Tax=Puccinia coronata f. sp. avenae TaxID=200324 RepID=A0A2N5TIH7_9BASI|nr:hypothetical protein PCANC_27230 [Puccinia coronata f. sp. avenae]